MHVIHGCLVARPFLLQGVFDFGLSPLIALELALRDFALIRTYLKITGRCRSAIKVE
jgi:hypothetical protein